MRELNARLLKEVRGARTKAAEAEASAAAARAAMDGDSGAVSAATRALCSRVVVCVFRRLLQAVVREYNIYRRVLRGVLCI